MQCNLSFLMRISLLSLWIALTSIVGASVVSAAVPATPPPWGTQWWAFSLYFQNIVNECSGNNVITGFQATQWPNYGRPICTDVNTLLNTNNSNPSFFSYWLSNDNGNNIFFTGANNVGIGTSSPLAKLDVFGGDAKINGLTIGRGNGNNSTNTVLWFLALSFANALAGNNVALGTMALLNLSTWLNNTAIGTMAGSNVTTGSNNILIGNNAQAPSPTGSNQLNIGNWIYGIGGNVGIGTNSPQSKLDVTGDIKSNGINIWRWEGSYPRNTIIGSGSLSSLSSAVNTGDRNTTLGVETLFQNTTGNANTAIGDKALYANTTGVANVGVGVAAGRDITGSNNTTVGAWAGSDVTTGNNNILIGMGVQAPSPTGSNQLNIGNWIYGNGGNIGIGTSTPAHKFDVNGNISTNDAYITSKWVWVSSLVRNNCRTVEVSGGLNPPHYVATASCAPDEVIRMGGGFCQIRPPAWLLHHSAPYGLNGWEVDCFNGDLSGENIATARIVCCK